MMRYIRKPEHDKRIARGDDYAGDAWLDTWTDRLRWGVVGHNMNLQEAQNLAAKFGARRFTRGPDSFTLGYWIDRIEWLPSAAECGKQALAKAIEEANR